LDFAEYELRPFGKQKRKGRPHPLTDFFKRT
jgi:hypothetical protein